MDDTTMQRRLGAAIRERRTALGFSQDTFADEIEMHRAYYSSIERGERNLTLSTLARVARGLKAQVAEILRDAGI